MSDSPLELPVLSGARVTLRPARKGELERLAELIAADPAASLRWSNDLPTMRRWLLEDEAARFLVVEHEGEAAGIVDYFEETDPHYRSAGMDIALLEEFSGVGLGTEALQLLSAWLIDVCGHHRLTIDPAADNRAAIHTYEKLGFKPIGIARCYERGVDATFHDNLLMDLLAEELVRAIPPGGL